ncbi:hypothetical protein V6N11_017388 [Hibiscus sabdariffa]|uniref:Uncharacterized protein n=1 Tax=Hibiscus sabdariffa TaxID=183260 RepID=A0ABR2TXV5_9ROSI
MRNVWRYSLMEKSPNGWDVIEINTTPITLSEDVHSSGDVWPYSDSHTSPTGCIMSGEMEEPANFLPNYIGYLVHKWGYRSEDAPLRRKIGASGSSGPTIVSSSPSSSSNESDSSFANLKHVTKRLRDHIVSSLYVLEVEKSVKALEKDR